MTEKNHNRGQILPEALKAEMEDLEKTQWLDDLLIRAGAGLFIIAVLGSIYASVFG